MNDFLFSNGKLTKLFNTKLIIFRNSLANIDNHLYYEILYYQSTIHDNSAQMFWTAFLVEIKLSDFLFIKLKFLLN